MLLPKALLRSPIGSTARIMYDHRMMFICLAQGTSHFPCAGSRQLPFCGETPYPLSIYHCYNVFSINRNLPLRQSAKPRSS